MIGLDFDGQSEKLVRDAVAHSDEQQSIRNEMFRKFWWMYLAYKDEAERDVDMPNIALPKLFSLIENKTPREAQALFGGQPFAPIKARRGVFQPVADIQVEVLDYLLGQAGLWEEGHLATKIKILHGTSFMNVLPYFDRVIEKKLIQSSNGGFEVGQEIVHRLRLRIETWAPWEVMVDPNAETLSQPDGCRYCIKIQLASKRVLKQRYEQGMYPGLDLDKLDNYSGGNSRWRGEHFGQEMLADLGLPVPSDDNDMGVLLRYESPDRYIDSWMGEVTLREMDNPYNHKKINLSRLPHTLSPHPNERFWGIGEAQPNEIQLAMLDDLYNLTFASHSMLNQPMVFFRKGRINARDIVFDLGRRVPVDSNSDRPIGDDFHVSSGNPLPRDHYMLTDQVERNVDLVAAEFDPSRGETSGGGTTATEVALTNDQGGKRQEGTIQVGENVFKNDFATKTLSIIDQFANFNDYAEIVGPERAVLIYTANPGDLPGGHNYEFKGSAQVNQLFMKGQALATLAPVLMGSEANRPGGIDRKLLELRQFTTDEINSMVLTEDELVQKREIEMAMMMMQQAQEQDNQQKQIENKSNTPPKKDKSK